MMRVAIVHDWLVTQAGGEKVLEQIIQMYPEADLYSLVDFMPADKRDFLLGKTVNTSFINKLPFAEKHYRNYLPLMPIAIEQFDMSSYDLVISSSAAISKGVITGPDQLHISYCHTPMRYAWDLQHQYLRESGLDRGISGMMARLMLHRARIWDYRTANGVDDFIANSKFIARRIHKIYRRESTVIYPPVDINKFALEETKEDYYLTASRLVPYKKIDLIVEAFSLMGNRKLVVVGDGPEMDKIKKKAGPNIEITGYQPADSLLKYMQKARAFVFAALEDFGIVPVEAQACGTPVIAYGHGGVRESVINGVTGVFYDNQDVGSIINAVTQFENSEYSPQVARENAERFSEARFRNEMGVFIDKKMIEFQKKY